MQSHTKSVIIARISSVFLFGLAASTYRHSFPGPSVATEQISQHADEEKVPVNLKDLFNELTTENALELHDKLEQREK